MAEASTSYSSQSDAYRTRRPRKGNFASDSGAALLSSSVFATAFYPFHRIKILLQTQDSNPLVVSGAVRRYTVVDALPRLIGEGGVPSLWRGCPAYMLRHVPSTTLSFAFKDALLRHLPHYEAHGEQLPRAAAVHLLAGFLGGAAALFLVYPLDFATIRMASELRQAEQSKGLVDTISSTQRLGGIRALYRGYGVSAAAIGSYKALYFGLYDTACAAMEQRRHGAPASLLERWGIANAVVMAASALTYPLDVTRKRLVADTALGRQRQYAGVWDCVVKTARREGIRGFYRFYGYDMLLRMGGGVLLVLYDELKEHGTGLLTRPALWQGQGVEAEAATGQAAAVRGGGGSPAAGVTAPQ